ncbi:hypothetical protein [Mycobacterium paragordonae]|uniref:hypothetical protein n=1 Tax=Mycobacterium paragordonae TaxID=1389713 RepID=UPI0012E3227D|nr:hypothetical protein [Mycobacterium paragordonae]
MITKAAYDDAHCAESLVAARAVVDSGRAAATRASDIARQALAGPGRTQVSQQLALIRARSTQRHAKEIAAQIAQFERMWRRGAPHPHPGRDRS